MDKETRDEMRRREKPLLLDMGLGSREQGFKSQKPKLKLVHSQDSAPA